MGCGGPGCAPLLCRSKLLSPEGVYSCNGLHAPSPVTGVWWPKGLPVKGASLLTCCVLLSRDPVRCRSKELSVKRELEVRADIKRAEILYTQRVQSRARLALFIHTKARPGLCWLPARHAEETLKLLEEEQQRLEEYKVGRP